MQSKSEPELSVDKPTRMSVVLSTYNAPQWLEKVIWGYAQQSYGEFEIVIADDGSDEQTAELLPALREQTSLTIKHVWHEDEGFRKCTILNRAVEACEGDYLFFSDGDCIPRGDLLREHYLAAERGRFLSGGYFKLPMSISDRITKADIDSGRAFTASWLREAGWKPNHRILRLIAGGRFAELLNRITTTRPTWNGHNASGWAEDIRAANGFDERMRYGGEDRELGERLENAGIRGKHVRFQTLCLHLDHARGYVRDEDLQRNREIRDFTMRLRRTRTDHGIRRAA